MTIPLMAIFGGICFIIAGLLGLGRFVANLCQADALADGFVVAAVVIASIGIVAVVYAWQQIGATP